MTYLIGAIAFIFVLGLIILVHEAGHFFFAKRAGILCHEFSLGMGPVIWQTKKGETNYSIRAIPIGGFVSMAGEELEADHLKGKTEVRIDIENKKIVRIVLDPDLKEFDNLPKVSIINYDLYGTKEAKDDELFIRYRDEEGNEIKTTVARDAIVIYNQKQRYQIAPYDRNFNNKPLWARFKSIVAGPLMNFALAIVLFLIVSAVIGTPNYDSTEVDKITPNAPVYEKLKDYDKIVAIDNRPVSRWEDISTVLNPLSKNYKSTIEIIVERNGERISYLINPEIHFYSVGIVSDYKTLDKIIVGNLFKDSHADKAGVKIGDEILKINGIEVASWQQLVDYFNTNTNGLGLTLEVKREGEVKTIEIDQTWNKEILEYQDLEPVDVKIGISPQYTFNISKWIPDTLKRTGSAFMLIINSLKLIFSNDQVGIGDLSGPIGIFDITRQYATQGLITLINWAAILSVNVGFLNLLPLPALDGGRLIFLGYEAVTRKKPSARVENFVHMIGFILLMGLFVIVAWNDILRLIGLK